MPLITPSQIELAAQLPVDFDYLQATTTTRDAIPNGRCYEGKKVYCQDTHIEYILLSTYHNPLQAGDWAISTNSGGELWSLAGADLVPTVPGVGINITLANPSIYAANFYEGTIGEPTTSDNLAAIHGVGYWTGAIRGAVGQFDVFSRGMTNGSLMGNYVSITDNALDDSDTVLSGYSVEYLTNVGPAVKAAYVAQGLGLTAFGAVPDGDMNLYANGVVYLNQGSGIVAKNVTQPPATATATLAGLGAGAIPNGKYCYQVTFVTVDGLETAIMYTTDSVTVVDKITDGQVLISNLPISNNPFQNVQSRKLYRYHYTSLFQGPGTLVDILDNVTTTYTDNYTDGGTGVVAPTFDNSGLLGTQSGYFHSFATGTFDNNISAYVFGSELTAANAVNYNHIFRFMSKDHQTYFGLTGAGKFETYFNYFDFSFKPLLIADGANAANPGLAFASALTTGMYLENGMFKWSVGGAYKMALEGVGDGILHIPVVESDIGSLSLMGYVSDFFPSDVIVVGNQETIVVDPASNLIKVFNGPPTGYGVRLPVKTKGNPVETTLGSLDYVAKSWTGNSVSQYIIRITGDNGTNFVYSWSFNGGTQATGQVVQDATPITLSHSGVDIQVLFTYSGLLTDNNYTVNDAWEIDTTAADVVAYLTNQGGWVQGITAVPSNFPNALSIISNGVTGGTLATRAGLAIEANSTATQGGTAIIGVHKTFGSFGGAGIYGRGMVNATGDIASARGFYGYAVDTHAGGDNIAFEGYAVGSDTGNYLLKGTGDVLVDGHIYGTEALLSTMHGIDGTAFNNFALYTVPAGKQAVITKVIIRCTSATSITVNNIISFGVAATGFLDWMPPTAIGLNTATFCMGFKMQDGTATTGEYKVYPAASVFSINETGATATALVYSIDVFGYLI